ncbi:hypothetical protein ABID25_003736 [Mesorhizobium abyssinicae]
MNCIHCGSTFYQRPFHYYFCSQMCWEVAKRDTPWRILSDGFGPFKSPVKSTTSVRYPRPSWTGHRTPRPDRVEVSVGMMQQY